MYPGRWTILVNIKRCLHEHFLPGVTEMQKIHGHQLGLNLIMEQVSRAVRGSLSIQIERYSNSPDIQVKYNHRPSDQRGTMDGLNTFCGKNGQPVIWYRLPGWAGGSGDFKCGVSVA